jgi:hypothetical protein
MSSGDVGRMALLACVIALVAGMDTSHAQPVLLKVSPAIAHVRFSARAPAGWSMDDRWAFSSPGATAVGPAAAKWDRQLPAGCRLELEFGLPAPEPQETPDEETPQPLATVVLTVGSMTDVNDQITVTASYLAHAYSVTIAGRGVDGKLVQAKVGGDTRPSVLRAWEQAQDHPGWAGQTVTLGLTLDADACRLLINGSEAARISTPLPARRRLSVQAEGIILRAARVFEAIEPRFAILSGRGLAMANGGRSAQPISRPLAEIESRSDQEASSTLPADPVSADGGSTLIDVGGIPMVVDATNAQSLTTIDVSAERHKSAAWSEGKGMIIAAVAPHDGTKYAAAHLLLYRPDVYAGKAPALGFGVRVPEWASGDLKNVYLGDTPVRYGDEGVTVKPVPELGAGWFYARVSLNPAAQQRPGQSVYLARPWTTVGGTPAPIGRPSAVQVAAITLEAAGVELNVTGNGLGNVYSEPDEPKLTATARNLTDQRITVRVTTELIPFERQAASTDQILELEPGDAKSFDVLAKPIRARGHYRVRIVADAGAAGRVEHRTNLAVLAPDTRKKADSPFGCWHKLWEDQATDEQRQYLMDKAGVSFVMNKHNVVVRLGTDIPDDEAAEKIVKGFSADAQVLMIGWEQNWGVEQTFAFPRVILEGKIESLSDETWEKVDETAVQWRRLIKATRRLRPDLKISLGNSGVNFTVPFLERGFRYGKEFDYFGTEEGLFGAMPEQPATATGNVNWWVKAICEHYGFEDVPIFHSESIYISTGAGLTRMPGRTQAAHYARAYLLGYPYDSIFGLAGAMIDSSNRYIYSAWGASGYCNQAPECSPKLSYVVFATLTQVLDGARYEGKLDTGSTSVYALRFRRTDGTPLYALWNVRAKRHARCILKLPGKPHVVDALNRPVRVRELGGDLIVELSELPLYVSGVELDRIEPGLNVVAAAPHGTLLASLEDLATWKLDTELDDDFAKPGKWTGVPKVMGRFDVTYRKGFRPAGKDKAGGAVTFLLRPQPSPHGLIPRYVSLTSPAGEAIAIPAGTTRLGMWVHGQSTWSQLLLGIEDDKGDRNLVPLQHGDCFDGWRFLTTGILDDQVQWGTSKINRLVVTMPAQQVYVDDLVTTRKPRIAVWGVHALTTKPPAVNYLPW